MNSKLAIAATTFIAAFAAGAETYTWTNAGWSPSGSPSSADTIVFNNDSTLNLEADLTVSEVQFEDGAKLTLTGSEKYLNAATFTGTGVISLSDSRLKCTTNGGEIPATIGVEIPVGTTKARITSGAGTLYFRGPLTGKGAVMLNFSGSGTGGVNLLGDNSGFEGTATVDGAGSNRMKFGASQAGSAKARWIVNGSTSDNGSITFSGGGAIEIGSIWTANYASGALMRLQNESSNKTLVIGALNREDDRLTLGTTDKGQGYGTIVKVGTGTLELWDTRHRNGTIISNGTVRVTHDNGIACNDSSVTFDGGALEYGKNPQDGDAAITKDISKYIKNSTKPISIKTTGADVTWATAIDSSNVDENGAKVGIVKSGEGTLKLSASQAMPGPLKVEGGRLELSLGSWYDDYGIDVAEGTSLKLSHAYNTTIYTIANAKLSGAGTIELGTGNQKGFRIGGDLSDFSGTLDFYSTTALNTACGIMPDARNLENTTVVVSGNPENLTHVVDFEKNAAQTFGALQMLHPNAKVDIKYSGKAINFGEKVGSESILNGPFSAAVKLYKYGNTPLTIGEGFEPGASGGELHVREASLLTINADLTGELPYTLEIASGIPLSGASTGKVSAAQFTAATKYVVPAGGGNLKIDGTVDLSSEAFDLNAFAEGFDPDEKDAEYPILTATSFTGTSEAMETLLSQVNASVKGGKWKVTTVSNGDGTVTLKCAFAKSGFVIVFR